MPRELWQTAGEPGLLGLDIDEEYGGGGISDFRFNAVLDEEIVRIGASGVGLRAAQRRRRPYLLDLATEEQKQRWLPGFCTGDMITAIAMTEPGAGCDLQGIQTTARDGDDYVLNGAKTFITNGINADLVIVVAKTDPEAGREGHQPDRRRARHGRLHPRPQAGQGRAQGAGHRRAVLRRRAACRPRTCSASENGGFVHLMENLPQERLAIAVGAVAAASACSS